MNNRIVYVLLGIFFLYSCYSTMLISKNTISIGELKDKAASITNDVKRLHDSMVVVDKQLLDNIKVSMDNIRELSKIKSMTLEEIRMLEESIKYEQLKIDQLKKNMTDW